LAGGRSRSSSITPALAEGRAIAAAMEGIARQPGLRARSRARSSSAWR
jgi:F0F1-type ATP synthase membrane subunit c/vacuolar-type H+-ATPase subunit K